MARSGTDATRSAASGPPTSSMSTLHFLRQQVDKPVERPDFCLADFIHDARVRRTGSAPSRSLPASASRHMSRASRPQHDDYNAILLKALADRLAEALAEALHRKVRRELWGYAATSHSTTTP